MKLRIAVLIESTSVFNVSDEGDGIELICIPLGKRSDFVCT